MNLLNLHKPAFFSVVVFSAIINFLMLAPTWYMLQVYDRVLTSRDENTLLGLSLIVLFVYLVYALLERYRSSILSEVALEIDQKISPKIRNAILNSTIKDRQKNINLFNDLNICKQFFTSIQLTSLLDIPWVFIYLIVIYILSPSLGYIASISGLLLVLLAVVNQKLTQVNQVEMSKTNMLERHLISTALNSSESIRAMSMQQSLGLKLQTIREDYLEALNQATHRGGQVTSITKFIRVSIQSGILGYGAYLSLQDQISAGMIIAASILLGRILSPIESVINSWKQISEFKRSAVNLHFLLVEATESKQHSIALGRPRGVFELNAVNLILREGYKPTLRDINLRMGAGKCMAIVGPSGAGKTSLLKIMAGVYTPTSGYVLVDGSDLAQMNHVEFGSYVGYLGQMTDLMAGKISENIARYGQIDSEAVIDAAKKCGAHEMILSLPQGYETFIGEQGNGLSEGQKRKVGLARALYKNPALLFLDEPDTNLDEPSLLQLSRLIETLKAEGVSVVLTTHKSNLAQQADDIAMLIDGELKLFGTSVEVLNKINPA